MIFFTMLTLTVIMAMRHSIVNMLYNRKFQPGMLCFSVGCQVIITFFVCALVAKMIHWKGDEFPTELFPWAF